MSTSIGSKFQFAPDSLTQLVFDITIGIASGCYCALSFISDLFHQLLVNQKLRTDGHEATQFDESEKKKTLKVAGVGYGRTGTYSLKLALDELGISTFHSADALLHSHKYFLDSWTKSIVLPSIESQTALLPPLDFNLYLNSGFEGAVDFPSAWYYEQILLEFPDCKFVLTTRKTSEVWFNSWNALSQSCSDASSIGAYFLPQVQKLSSYFRWMFARVNMDNSFLTKPFPLPPQNKTAVIRSYEEHNQRVREIIPPQQLLEYDVKQGWQPLCDFLEITNCPTTPFPKTHSSTSMQAQSASFFVVVGIIIITTLYYLVKQVKRTMSYKK